MPKRTGLSSDRRAAAAVEFAVSAVPMMTLVFGFIAVSAVFNTMSSMQSNAQYAARMMATGQATQFGHPAVTISGSNTTATTTCANAVANTVESYACQGLPTWATFTVTSTENCAVPSVTVSISTSASTAAIADVVAIFSGRTLTEQAALMKEGSCP